MKYKQALYYMYVVKVENYDYNFCLDTIKKKEYLKIFACFDIETSALHDIEQSFMYIWQFYIDGVVVIGRTWKEFINFITTIQAKIGNNKLVVYCHNLSYEFQYLSGIYKFVDETVFAVKSRKVLKCLMRNIEFRCSYLLSNMSLAEYTAKMKVKHRKLTGELNYDIVRYSDTELSIDELAYCINDVLGLHEAIETEMALENDNIGTIPLTSTGYVRRDCRKVMWKYRNTLIKKIYPTYACYSLLREAFRGGNTHANRFYSGIIMSNVKSIDISSSYPYVINNERYPITKLVPVETTTEDEIKNHIQKDKAVLFKVVLENVELKDDMWGCPYLSVDKCRGIIDYENDNGRILKARMLETTITDIDYKIISEEYNYTQFIVKECYIAKYGDIPKELKEVINKYYTGKTELKGVPGQEVYYTKQKNKTNSIYGMMAQNPVKQNISYLYNPDKDIMEFKEQDNDEWTLLLDSEKNAFLPYQWGVWTTAHARYNLEQGIKMAGYNFVYCDTDSVKYIGVLKGLEDYNVDKMYRAEQTGSYAKDRKGIVHFMGVYEHEKPYKRFITFGAKKYAYEYADGTLGITIAGVHKIKGSEELKKSGGLDKLKVGYVFYEGGGNEFIHNDSNFGWYTTKDGHTVYITKNIYSKPSTYKLGVTPTYGELIKTCKESVKHLIVNY